MLPGGCVTAPAEPAPPETAAVETVQLRPVALRLNLTGKAPAVFGGATAIPVLLARTGTQEPVAAEFTPGALTRLELPPGDYAVSRIGPMACSGIGFTLTPGAEPRALGVLDAEILQTEYDIALIGAGPASAADLAELGSGAQSAPLFIDRKALCHAGRGGPGTQYHDLTLAQKITVGVFFAGFCAAAVASGGFCAF